MHAPAGYDVVLLSDAGDAADAPTRTLLDAVESWAADEDVTVTPFSAKGPDDRIAAVLRAVDAEPDLVITVGNHMVDPLAAVSPTALHQQFLVVGAEIAEPTSNVTAADWTGGGFRGEGPRSVEPLRPGDLQPRTARPVACAPASPPCSTTCAASSSGCPDRALPRYAVSGSSTRARTCAAAPSATASDPSVDCASRIVAPLTGGSAAIAAEMAGSSRSQDRAIPRVASTQVGRVEAVPLPGS